MPHSNNSVNGSGHNYQIPPYLIGEIARQLLSEPNRLLSTKNDLRFGNHGSLSVNVEKGIFYDHENKIGGGILDFIEGRGWAEARIKTLTGGTLMPASR
jgi:hypothetical protein